MQEQQLDDFTNSNPSQDNHECQPTELGQLEITSDEIEFAKGRCLGRILAVLPTSTMTVEDIMRLTGSKFADEIIAEDGLIYSEQQAVIAYVRTAVEIINRFPSSEGVRCYKVDDDAVSTLYSMADDSFLYALDFDADSFEDFRMCLAHAASMITIRDELWSIARFYDSDACPLPNARTGWTLGDADDELESDWDWHSSAIVARSAYQLCLKSYEDAVSVVRELLVPKW
jgi:hypothetical protein